ncbi:hypothetical protein JHK82_054334 [Glycine max]|nr:hypothetical protein JHK82_054334 [Glycine max]
MRTQQISLLLKKRFATPNWVKLKITGNEVKQVLPQDMRKHHRVDSSESTASSRSNSFGDEKLSRSNNIQKGRNQQLLETQK